jgi:hypothetical protein
MKPYGLELLHDLKDCDLIGMKRHGNPVFWEDHSGIPHLHRTVRLLVHRDQQLRLPPAAAPGAVYLNVFSCKEFDTEAARRFSANFWKAGSVVFAVVTRT